MSSINISLCFESLLVFSLRQAITINTINDQLPRSTAGGQNANGAFDCVCFCKPLESMLSVIAHVERNIDVHGVLFELDHCVWRGRFS